MLRKGDEMTSLLLLFVACIATMFVAMWLFSKKEDTAFHETMQRVLRAEAKLKELDELLASNIQTVGNANVRIKKVEDDMTCFTGRVEKAVESVEKEIEHLQEHCAKLRESQISLKDMLANKRPVLKITTPIPVSVVTKPDATLIKKIKKQIKDVSQ